MPFQIENGILKKYEPEAGITEVAVPEGVTELADCSFAFHKGRELVRVTLPESVKYIGNGAFSGCKNLAEVVLPEGLEKIGAFAFSECEALEKLILPQSVKTIWRNAFGSCTALKELVIPVGVSDMEPFVILRCDNLCVIKLRPDDPVIFRDYKALKDGSLGTIWEMMQTGNCSLRIERAYKFPFLLLHYLHTRDAGLEAYLKKNFAKLVKESITAGDLPMIEGLTRTDAFVTKRNIGKLIQQALDENQTAIYAHLVNYKKNFI